MVVVAVDAITSLFSTVIALVGSAGALVAGFLAFLRTQGHSTKISNLIEKISTIDGKVMAGATQIGAIGQKDLGTGIALLENVIPSLQTVLTGHDAQLKQLAQDIENIKALVNHIGATVSNNSTNTTTGTTSTIDMTGTTAPPKAPV